MRVLLVSPTALDMAGRPIKQRRIHLPGLTLQMLAAATPPGVELRLVNETAQDIPFEEPWDLVGLTGMGSGLMRAWQLADEFRARGRKVVVGGIAASLCPPEWTLQHADTLVVGEAEDIWPTVLEDARLGQLQEVYRPARPPDIETLHIPRYDLMRSRSYGFWTPVQATRGCPFTCTFCSITSYFNQHYRKRPVDQVIRDVRAAKKRIGTRYVAFIDDNIGVDWDYCTELWEALIPERVIWMSQCSLHIADRPDMLALARKSGCRLLSYGIETTSDDSLAGIDKAWNQPERYRTAIDTIRGHGIDVSSEMIIGLDQDDADVFDRTYDFIMDNHISVPRVHILTPVPGTPLYEEMKREGRITSDDIGRFSGGQVVFELKNFSHEEMQAQYWRLYEKLFKVSAIRHRIGRNRARLGAYMRGVVLSVNLHYRNHINRRICPGIV